MPESPILFFPEELASFEASVNPSLRNFLRLEVRERKVRNVNSGTSLTDILRADNSAIGANQRTEATGLSIYLPMPSAVVVNNSMSWENTELGVAGAFDATGSVGKVVDAVKKDFKSFGDGKGFSTLDSVSAASKSLVKATDPVITDLVLKTISTLTGLNIKERSEIAQGRVRNHNLALLFKGIGFRQFSFTWKLAPKSETETTLLANIIRNLKLFSSPTLSNPTAGWFGYPDEWALTFKSAQEGGGVIDNPGLPKIGICVMNSIEVNYTPDGLYASFRDGNPTMVDLSINLTETEIVSREKIEEGY